MKYEILKHYNNKKFRRATSIKRKTFEKMIEILNAKYAEEHSHNTRNSGRKSKLTMEAKLLATLLYLRHYTTYVLIAASYGISESCIYRTIKWVEDTITQDRTFGLPGKKHC